jgi:NAD(P)-dependent dehydrogenase (short-subunit alcohol dehydrogenase family)
MARPRPPIRENLAVRLASALVARRVLVTGASGYLGRALIPQLLDRGHRVHALVRLGSEKKIRQAPR